MPQGLLEWVFLLIYAIELSLRLFSDKLVFFSKDQNLFDLTIVCVDFLCNVMAFGLCSLLRSRIDEVKITCSSKDGRAVASQDDMNI